MMISKTKCLLVAATLILSACAEEVSRPEGTKGNGQSNQETPPVAIPEFKGIVADGTKQQVVKLDPTRKELLVSIPLGKNIFLNMTERPVTGLRGARAYTSEDAQGNKFLVVVIPVKYSLQSVMPGTTSVLPNGDPLPYVPTGELPKWSFEQDNVKIHIYAALDSVGLFIESAFDPRIALGWDIRDSNQQKIGLLASIPAKAPHQGGFFLGITLPAELARLLDKVVQ